MSDAKTNDGEQYRLFDREQKPIDSTTRVNTTPRQVVVAVEDARDPTNAAIVAFDPTVDDAVVTGIVLELVDELRYTFPDAAELVADELEGADS